MALFDTLGGVTQAKSSAHIYLIGSGLAASTPYYLFTTTADPLNDTYAVSSATTNAFGNCFFSLTQVTFSATYWLHTNSNAPHAGGIDNSVYRVANGLPVAWASGYASPNYGTPAVLGPVVPGQTIISVQWSAAIECDARVSTKTYDVRSSSAVFPPGSGTSIASGLTVTGYTATGFTVNTQHWLMIRTTFKYLNDLITPVNELVTPAGSFDSNIVAVTTKPQKEIWGMLAVPP